MLAAAACLAACAHNEPPPFAPVDAGDLGHTGPAIAGGRPTIASPIRDICAYPGGRAVLDHDLPGLTGRPEYMFFESMSLKSLQSMSKGQLTSADLAKVDADLASLEPAPQTAR